MVRKYKLNDGSVIRAYVSDFGSFEIMGEEGNVLHTYEYDYLNDDKYVVHNGEVIYINNFMYDDIDTMIKKVEKAQETKDRFLITQDELLATFMKEKDRVAVMMEVEEFDIVIPELGFGLKGTNSNKVMVKMVPCQEGRYPINMWHYKIQFEPEDPFLLERVGREAYYFCDFADMLFTGWCKLTKV